ncbi:PREDICTED: hepatocyte nuclear factor 6, partial [Tinamus guttatus]|uniref:hepatocyte nuclear factor 6 n=1 Tax=Tinamus guttatus TaxID=94827 RepID=UPI00052F2578
HPPPHHPHQRIPGNVSGSFTLMRDERGLASMNNLYTPYHKDVTGMGQSLSPLSGSGLGGIPFSTAFKPPPPAMLARHGEQHLTPTSAGMVPLNGIPHHPHAHLNAQGHGQILGSAREQNPSVTGSQVNSGSNSGQMEEINTKEVAQRITTELKRYSIPQAIFAQRVLCRSQGTLSDLLRNPKPWSKLASIPGTTSAPELPASRSCGSSARRRSLRPGAVPAASHRGDKRIQLIPSHGAVDIGTSPSRAFSTADSYRRPAALPALARGYGASAAAGALSEEPSPLEARDISQAQVGFALQRRHLSSLMKERRGIVYAQRQQAARRPRCCGERRLRSGCRGRRARGALGGAGGKARAAPGRARSWQRWAQGEQGLPRSSPAKRQQVTPIGQGKTISLRGLTVSESARGPVGWEGPACKRKEQEHGKDRGNTPKKPRLVFTDVQRRTLHAIFKENKRPSKELQITISQQLGLELSTVSNFFMNARRRSLDKWQDEGSSNSGNSSSSSSTCTKA